MDGSQFDALSRTFAVGRSRRGLTQLLAGLAFGGSLANLQAMETKAKKKRGKRKKRRRGGPRIIVVCTPNCEGRTCGSDGCGGTCGPCGGGSCQAGACSCLPGQELCAGTCISMCAAGEVRVPGTCDCCLVPGDVCTVDSECCSNRCVMGTTLKACRGGAWQEACTFGAQCESGECVTGQCTCKGDVCGGACLAECRPFPLQMTRNPQTCECCTKNGFACTTGPCCSGTCNAGTGLCTGLPGGAPCTFDAQCTSGTCLGTCLGDIGA